MATAYSSMTSSHSSLVFVGNILDSEFSLSKSFKVLFLAAIFSARDTFSHDPHIAGLFHHLEIRSNIISSKTSTLAILSKEISFPYMLPLYPMTSLLFIIWSLADITSFLYFYLLSVLLLLNSSSMTREILYVFFTTVSTCKQKWCLFENGAHLSLSFAIINFT